MVLGQNIEYTYDQKQVFKFPEISCAAGNTALIIGKSGVGKSTILHLLGGLMKPTKGQIEINDKNIGELEGSNLDKFRGNHIGIIFQKNHFVSSLNVEENLILAQYLGTGKNDKEYAHQLLDNLNILHKSKSKINNLSEGEKQRVSIARALINRPKLILADEPTSALDDENCTTVFNLLNEEAKKVNAALIIVTHDQRLKDKVSHKITLL